MARLKRFARCIGWAGLTSAGVLHAVWATGSSWPERNRKRLAQAVVGSRTMPGAAPTATVAAAALLGGAVAAGGLGDGRAAVALRRVMGAGLLARAVLGGDTALATLRLPPAGERFSRLDATYYRPLFGLLGAALLLGARK